jgi:hypothetical protein
VKTILLGVFGSHLRKSNLKVENRVVDQRPKSYVWHFIARCQREGVHTVVDLNSFRIDCESCRRR